jgi:hypothetical protein
MLSKHEGMGQKTAYMYRNPAGVYYIMPGCDAL